MVSDWLVKQSVVILLSLELVKLVLFHISSYLWIHVYKSIIYKFNIIDAFDQWLT